MTSKERVLKTYKFKRPDRIPLDFCACESVYKKLRAYYKAHDNLKLMERLHIDFRWARAPWIGPELKDEEGYPVDYFGIRRGGLYFGIANTHPLENIKSKKDIDEYKNWPKPEYFNYDIFVEECNKFEEYAVYGGAWSWFFNAACDLVGMDKFFLMVYDQPELAYHLLEQITDFFYENSKIMFEKAKGKVDIFFTGDDYGSQSGLLISPEMWRKMIKPHIERLYSLAKEYNLMITQHSCGSIIAILPDLIQLGLSTIEPVQVQAAGMNFRNLLTKFRAKVCLQGSINTQSTLPLGTPEDVRNEVLERIRDFKEIGGGFIFGPSQHLLEEIPLENIVTMYQVAWEYGWL